MASSLLARVVSIFGFISFIPTTYGQDFSVPLSWRVECSTNICRLGADSMLVETLNHALEK